MAAALRGLTARPGRLPVALPLLLPALLFALPLLAALAYGLGDALQQLGWVRLLDDPQTASALTLSLWTGAASTSIALAITLWLVAHLHGGRAWRRVERSLGALLAVPHAALAIGLALLVMPSGLVARLVAALAGWSAPPDWRTVHDGAGLALIAALVLKEVPFLLWSVVALLRRPEQGAALERQLQVAQSLGYTPASAWWRVLWPQLLPRLALPLLAVWAYGVTVVDMALVLGPTQPPTLGVLAWGWLLDADPARNAQGAAAALALTLVVAAGALLAALAWRGLRGTWQRRAARGDRPAVRSRGRLAPALASLGASLVAAPVLMLALVSLVGVWTFPALWPQVWSADAWRQVAGSLPVLGLTLGLGLAAAAGALVLAVAWLESTPAAWDRRAAPLWMLPLLLPGLLLVAGLYRLALQIGVDGRWSGLWIAHLLFTAPYALIALAPAYRGFDPRYAQTAAALGRSTPAFLWRVKWPMLRAPLAAAFAIAFAVSVAQYLPTQFVGAGRHASVTTEAVTLAAGGQRSSTAAFALLQALLPALVFGLALAATPRRGA